MNEKKQSKAAQLISGILLIAVGLIGIFKRKKIVSRSLRAVVSILSVASVAAGIYLFVLGFDDVAIFRLGANVSGEKIPQMLIYQSPEAFEADLKKIFESQNSWYDGVRRLSFICADKSEGFRVFHTAAGIFGVPKSQVNCKDGSVLLKYSSN